MYWFSKTVQGEGGEGGFLFSSLLFFGVFGIRFRGGVKGSDEEHITYSGGKEAQLATMWLKGEKEKREKEKIQYFIKMKFTKY